MSRFLRTVIIFFVVVMARQVVAAQPGQSRELQYLWVEDGYQIAVDNDPAWKWALDKSKKQSVLIIETPDLYYPPATVNVRYMRGEKISSNELYFKKVADSAIAHAAVNFGGSEVSEASLTKTVYGQLTGYEKTFNGKVNGDDREIKIFVCRNKSNEILVMSVITLLNKMTDIEPAVERIWSHISFLEHQ